MHSAIHQSWRTSISDASFYLLTPGAHHNRPIVTYFRISIKLFNPLNVLQPHTPQLTAPHPPAYSPTPPQLFYSHTTCARSFVSLKPCLRHGPRTVALAQGPATSKTGADHRLSCILCMSVYVCLSVMCGGGGGGWGGWSYKFLSGGSSIYNHHQLCQGRNNGYHF